MTLYEALYFVYNNRELSTYLSRTHLQLGVPSRQESVAEIDISWDFEEGVHPNSTAHLVFETVNSLLQQWPNTRYRNGHNIVAGTIPVGTLLYHGRNDYKLPTVPEWTATDPQHSELFCWRPDLPLQNKSTVDRLGCWHLTLSAVRPLKVLYFDGNSAAKLKEGTLDSQDIMVWGKISPERRVAERERLSGLCEWGKQFGIDGYLSEVMLCDFKHGVELVSADYLSRPWDPPREIRDRYPNHSYKPGWFMAATPEKTRVQLDLTRLVSFYDTSLVPSLMSQRATTDRWAHRLQGIDATDTQAVMQRLSDLLKSHQRAGSGVDWRVMIQVVVDRYADHLELADYLLSSATKDNLVDAASKVLLQLRSMLRSYLLHSSQPPSDSNFAANQSWALPVWNGCATRDTVNIRSNSQILKRFTASEHMLLSAIEGTNREICRVLVSMWTEGVVAGLDAAIPVVNTTSNIPAVVEHWTSQLSVLMKWLDWSVWVKCKPACGFEELCFLPTYPFSYSGIGKVPEDPRMWRTPAPRCIRRIEPYSPF
ncbi:hypothetical protein C8J57DRAFT_1581577 [Mycena rebaudengoi]|nr:hypothetical protein C8J57DRAFT_1581577 [Mycena rebaudengoi]